MVQGFVAGAAQQVGQMVVLIILAILL